MAVSASRVKDFCDAIGRGDTAAVEKILSEAKTNPYLAYAIEVDPPNSHPLEQAAREGHVDIVRAMLNDQYMLPPRGDSNAFISKLWPVDIIFKLLCGQIECHQDVWSALATHEKVDINWSNEAGQSVLMLAAKAAKLNIVKALLKHPDIKVNAADRSRRTALHYAAKHDKDVVEALLTHPKVNVNATCRARRAALHIAVIHDDSDSVRALLRHKDISVNLKEGQGSTALIIAAERSGHGTVEALLEHGNVDINAKNMYGWTALHYAASKNTVDITRALLKHEGIRTNAENNNGMTPLMLAAGGSNHEAALALLEDERTDVNAKCKENASVLHHFMVGGNEDTVRKLLQRSDIKIKVKDKRNFTPLMVGAELDNDEAVTALLENKDVDVNEKDESFKNTALHIAATKGAARTISILVERGADINARNNYLYTPLMLAAYYRQIEAVTALLGRSETDINAANVVGGTALHLAAAGQAQEIVPMLLNDNRIEPNRQTSAGWTALEYAVEDAVHLRNAPISLGLVLTFLRCQRVDPHGALPLFKRGDNISIDMAAHALAGPEYQRLRSMQSTVAAYDDCFSAIRARPSEDNLIELLEKWVLFKEKLPDTHAQASGSSEREISRLAQEQSRRQLLSGRTNFFLGSLLAKKEDQARRETGSGIAVVKACAKGSEFRLTLALEKMMDGKEAFPEIQACAAELLRAAPDARSFNIKGVHWLRSEIADIASKTGLVVERIFEQHGMDRTRMAGISNVHHGMFTLRGQNLLYELKKRNSEAGERQRAPVAAEVVRTLRTLTHLSSGAEAFAPVFSTFIYDEYVQAFQKYQGKLADFLGGSSGEGLADLVTCIHTEVNAVPFETVRGYYPPHAVENPQLLHITDEEIHRRRTMPEIERVLRNIRQELLIRPEIEAFITNRVFENGHEAWLSMPLTEQAEALVGDIMHMRQVDASSARRILYEILESKRSFKRVASELAGKQMAASSEMAEEMLYADGATAQARLVQSAVSRSATQDVLAAVAKYKDEVGRLIAANVFGSHQEASKALDNIETENWHVSRDNSHIGREELRGMRQELRHLARRGLQLAFFHVEPVEETDVRTDTHTALQTTWDYARSRPQAILQDRLSQNFLETLIEIGHQTPCAAGIALRTLEAASLGDESLLTRSQDPAPDILHSLLAELNAAGLVDDFESDLEELMLAPQSGKRGGPNDDLLAPQDLRRHAGIDESDAQTLQTVKEKLNSQDEVLRKLLKNKSDFQSLRQERQRLMMKMEPSESMGSPESVEAREKLASEMEVLEGEIASQQPGQKRVEEGLASGRVNAKALRKEWDERRRNVIGALRFAGSGGQAATLAELQQAVTVQNLVALMQRRRITTGDDALDKQRAQEVVRSLQAAEP